MLLCGSLQGSSVSASESFQKTGEIQFTRGVEVQLFQPNINCSQLSDFPTSAVIFLLPETFKLPFFVFFFVWRARFFPAPQSADRGTSDSPIMWAFPLVSTMKGFANPFISLQWPSKWDDTLWLFIPPDQHLLRFIWRGFYEPFLLQKENCNYLSQLYSSALIFKGREFCWNDVLDGKSGFTACLRCRTCKKKKAGVGKRRPKFGSWRGSKNSSDEDTRTIVLLASLISVTYAVQIEQRLKYNKGDSKGPILTQKWQTPGFKNCI